MPTIYLATRELRTPRGIIKPGEEIIDAEEWDHTALRANINMGYIEKVDGVSKSEVKRVAVKKAPKPAPVKAAEPQIFQCKCGKYAESSRGLKRHKTIANHH